MDVISDKRTLMHVESMAAQHTHIHTPGTHKQNSHLLICQLRCYALNGHVPECVCSSLRERYQRNIAFVLETGLGNNV